MGPTKIKKTKDPKKEKATKKIMAALNTKHEVMEKLGDILEQTKPIQKEIEALQSDLAKQEDAEKRARLTKIESENKCQTVESAFIYPNNVLLSARVLLVFSQLF